MEDPLSTGPPPSSYFISKLTNLTFFGGSHAVKYLEKFSLSKYFMHTLFNKFAIWLRYILSPTNRQVDPVFIEGGNESVCSCLSQP